MKKQYLSALFLFSTGLCLIPALNAGTQLSLPYYVTLDGAYGRPFGSPGYSGRIDNGFGGALSFEYRGWNAASIGLGLNHVAISAPSFSTGLGSADLFARLLPFGPGPVEPYALLGAGSTIYSSSSDAAHVRDNAFHADLQLGALFSFNPQWALNTSLGYQMAGSPTFNYVDFRLGIQSRFGKGGAPAEKAEPEKPKAKELDEKKLKEASSKLEWNLAPGAMSVTAKAWTLEIYDKNGKLVKTMQGKGPAPKEFHVQGLMMDQEYHYQLTLIPASGKLVVKKGVLPEPSPLAPAKLKKNIKTAKPQGPSPSSKPQGVSPTAKPKAEFKVRPGDSLWAIAARPEIYADGLLWPQLYDANRDRIRDPQLILDGIRLVVPKLGDEEATDKIRLRAYHTRDRKQTLVATATER